MTTFCTTGGESGASLCEDLDSRIYYDVDDERFSVGSWGDVQEEDNLSLRATVTPEEIEARAQAQRTGDGHLAVRQSVWRDLCQVG